MMQLFTWATNVCLVGPTLACSWMSRKPHSRLTSHPLLESDEAASVKFNEVYKSIKCGVTPGQTVANITLNLLLICSIGFCWGFLTKWYIKDNTALMFLYLPSPVTSMLSTIHGARLRYWLRRPLVSMMYSWIWGTASYNWGKVARRTYSMADMTLPTIHWITCIGLASTVTADRMTSLGGGIARSWKLPPGISIESTIVYLCSSLYHSFLEFNHKRWFLNKPNGKRKCLYRTVT